MNALKAKRVIRVIAGQFLKNEFCIDNIDEGFKMSVVIGEIYTASDCERKGYYILAEKQTYMEELVCYPKENFIPLSEIDETEMKREYNLVIKT